MNCNLLPHLSRVKGIFGVVLLAFMLLTPSLSVSASTQTITFNKAYFEAGTVDSTNTYRLIPIFVTPALTTEAFSVLIDNGDLSENYVVKCLNGVKYTNDAYWISTWGGTNTVLTDNTAIWALSASNASTNVTIAIFSGVGSGETKVTYDYDSNGSPASVDATADPLAVKPKALVLQVATGDISGMTGSGTLTLTYHQATSDLTGSLIYIAIPVVLLIGVFKKLRIL